MARISRPELFLACVFFLTLVLSPAPAVAQNRPEDGGRELQVWTGGGYSVPGGTKIRACGTPASATDGSSPSRTSPAFSADVFELAVDAVPAFAVFQRSNTAFGGGVNPIGFKWIFATRGHVAPYLELNGGTLFTTHEVPAGTSTINFTTGAAFGMYFLRDHAWSLDVRYMHISNAGLTVPNPGLNTVQVRLGFGKFFNKK